MNNVETLEQLCEALSTELGKCEKCGLFPAVVAVFENNESNEIIGFKIFCECNSNKEMSQEEMANSHTYTIEEIKDMIENHKSWINYK